MIAVGICGYGYTGSGAVWDLLKEYQDCTILGGDKEFTFLYAPDGIDDLRYHLLEKPARFQSSDVAIYRFSEYITKMATHYGWEGLTNNRLLELSKKYIESICMVSWDGYWTFDIDMIINKPLQYNVFRIKRKLEHVFKFHFPSLLKKREMHLSIFPENFDALTSDFIIELLRSMTRTSLGSVVALNQAFPANCPEKFMKYLPNSKAIVVDKDPRDSYILAKQVIGSGASWIPVDNVKDFVTYYRALRASQVSRNDILRINFEDLIYKYENTKEQIEKFLGIKEHIYKNRFFDPNISIGNVMLFNRYEQYHNDIRFIEKEIPEYIYSFDGLKKPGPETKPFDK